MARKYIICAYIIYSGKNDFMHIYICSVKQAFVQWTLESGIIIKTNNMGPDRFLEQVENFPCTDSTRFHPSASYILYPKHCVQWFFSKESGISLDYYLVRPPFHQKIQTSKQISKHSSNHREFISVSLIGQINFINTFGINRESEVWQASQVTQW